MKKLLGILVLGLLLCNQPLMSADLDYDKIDFDWFNSEEYKMAVKMNNCRRENHDGSYSTCNPFNAYRHLGNEPVMDMLKRRGFEYGKGMILNY